MCNAFKTMNARKRCMLIASSASLQLMGVREQIVAESRKRVATMNKAFSQSPHLRHILSPLLRVIRLAGRNRITHFLRDACSSASSATQLESCSGSPRSPLRPGNRFALKGY